MRRTISPKSIQIASEAFVNEMTRRLEQKGPGGFTSIHEIRGVIDEEVDELHDAVRSNDYEEVQKEILDILVGTFWGLCSMTEGVDW